MAIHIRCGGGGNVLKYTSITRSSMVIPHGGYSVDWNLDGNFLGIEESRARKKAVPFSIRAQQYLCLSTSVCSTLTLETFVAANFNKKERSSRLPPSISGAPKQTLVTY